MNRQQLAQIEKNKLLGWTEEDQAIWRARKMPAHTIKYRYQQHMREAAIMRCRSRAPLKPSTAKEVAMQFIGIDCPSPKK